MDLSIIIVNWNSRDFLAKCISSVVKFTKDIGYEIIVIDSGSFDGSADLVHKCFPAVVFIQCDKNVGFARANNLAFRYASGRNILFLNPDTELMSPAINAMMDYLDSSVNAGVVGCRLVNYDNTLQTSCVQAFPSISSQLISSGWLMRKFPKIPLWGMSVLFEENLSAAEVEVISGACMMMRRGVFEQVAKFTEDYFMYTEDIDLCYKTRLAGYRNYYVSSGLVKHYGGGSSESAPSNFSAVMMRDSILRYFRKYRGKTYANIYRISTGIAGGLRLFMLAPLWLLLGWHASASKYRGSIGKWCAIIRWSITGSAQHTNFNRTA